ncbi:MAG: ATP phosphoribosyltransferase [Dehalococcoidia bacterium]
MSAIRLALPAGRLRQPAAVLLTGAGLKVMDYGDGSRSYRPRLVGRNDIQLRVFRERDIPIQIALGNYDLGICDLAWVEELLQRYPSEAVVKVCSLGFGRSCLFAAVAATSAEGWCRDRRLRIVSEYPNLAEAFAMAARLSYHRVLPVWGAAEAYPPEDADIAVVAAADEAALPEEGLVPISCLLRGSAWLIAHRQSLKRKDLAHLLTLLTAAGGGSGQRLHLPAPGEVELPPLRNPTRHQQEHPRLRLALPDGHQQPHAVAILQAAGLPFDGYTHGTPSRRPRSHQAEVEAKVIRPQDMPQQVALGNFDLAITGRDWLLEHLRRVPDSPVEEAADLGRGRYTIAAVVSQDLPADNLEEALALWRRDGRRTIRVASEYANLADHYARCHHFGHYQVIPISGAAEGFVPEDADILIEGTETGRTLAENGLKIIDPLFSSTTCLIASKGRLQQDRDGLLGRIVTMLAEAASERDVRA